MNEKKFLYRSVNDAVFALGTVVSGVVAEIGKLPKEFEERRYIVVDTGEALVRVYENWGLAEAFKRAKIGHSISITYQGEKPIKGNKTLKIFDVRLWQE